MRKDRKTGLARGPPREDSSLARSLSQKSGAWGVTVERAASLSLENLTH